MISKRFKYWLKYDLKCRAYLPVTFLKRVVFGRDDPAKRFFWDKWAVSSFTAPAVLKERPNIWVVANSGGEVMQSLIFLKKLKSLYPGYNLVLSTESYDTFKYCLKSKELDFVFFNPWDIPAVCKRILRVVKPKLMIFIEHCYFPVLAREAKNSGCKILMFSAKISPDLLQENFLLERSFGLRFYDHMDFIGVKTEEDKKALLGFGVLEKNISGAGDMRLDLAHLLLSAEDKEKIRQEAGIGKEEKVFLVGSAHQDEVGLIMDVFNKLRQKYASLKLILAPRWNKEIHSMESIIKENGYCFRLRSGAAGNSPYDVLILDTFGELPYFYGIASVAFISSSIVPINARKLGHNIFEPLAHGVPTLFGPHMNSWREASEYLKKVWPGCEVSDAESLAESIDRIIADSAISTKLKDAALSLSADKKNIINGYLELVEGIL